MAKSFKLSNIGSVGLSHGRVRISKVHNGTGKKLQRVNTRLIIVKGAKNSQVLPETMVREVEKVSEDKPYLILSFREAFGVLGAPMLVTLVACIFWTTWLICIALAPNDFANWLMGTGTYDNGQFWLIIDTDPGMVKVGAAGLMFVNACYLYVLVKMLRWRKTVLHLQQNKSLLEEEQKVDSATDSWLRTASTHCKTQYKNYTSFYGSKRKLWMTVLLELLETGNPATLLYGYTAFISVGSLAGAIKILVGKFSAMGEVIAGSVFDLFAAIVFPVVVLVYCYYNFHFDDAVFATYLEILPPGSFEQTARVFADPSEIALFQLAFDSLRIRSLLDFVLRVGINLSFCYRLKRIGDVLVVARLRRFQSIRAQRARPSKNFQRPVPRVFAVFFIAFSVVVWIFANQAITDSYMHCAKYPQCVVYAYRWKFDEEICPCRILIDADRAPKTYDEWIQPVDVHDTVQALAISGELRSLQLINRQLLELPDELQACQYLMSLELIYTSTQHIPSWAKKFKYLQTLHLEGKQGENLRRLPEDLFSDMPWLSTVHIGHQETLESFPELRGVPNLQSLTLGWLLELRKLPPFDGVPRLQNLVLTLMPHHEQVPDMEPLRLLSNFTLSGPVQLCCNGFLGTCDLSDNYCAENPSSGIPAGSCLASEPFLGNVGTREVFNKFNSTICQKLSSDMLVIPGVPTKQTIEMCDSKPFGECQLPDGRIGICYNTRMQVLSCYGDENYIALRRFQIQKGVGKICDPVLEKWLGCGD